jgi:hypothetical protein
MPLRAFSAVALLTLGLACDKRDEAPKGEPAPVQKPVPAEDPSIRIPVPGRLVAIGDVHGDVEATRTALRLAGAIDAEGHWNGGKLVVVQTGDQLDRGDEEPEILDLFDRLKDEAKKAGGAFVALNGNHEVMNVAGDFRYVTEDGFRDFSNVPGSSPKLQALPPEQRGRGAAFAPGGPLARRLAERPVAIVAGDSVFVHGGILPAHVEYGIGRMNAETRSWMRGERKGLPAILNGDSAPIWSRAYSDGEVSARECEELDRVLSDLEVKRMVVGHTVQKNGITSACSDKVWRIDVGLAKHYRGTPAVLEIKDGKTRIVREDSPAPAPSASASR